MGGSPDTGTHDLSPDLIGRDAELLQLRRRLADAADGRGSVTAIRGEAGLGKSRLLDEAAAIGTEHGFEILRGRAETTEAQLPYGLFAGVLSNWAAAGGGRWREAVEQLVGELVPHLWPKVFAGDAPQGAEEPADSPELRQNLFLARLLTELFELAESQPVLILLDDLHWADSSSLQAFQHLSQQVAGASVAIVVTVRPGAEEGGREALVRRMLQELHRGQSFHLVDLALLTQEQTHSLVSSCLRRGGLSAEVYEILYRKSGGVPLHAVQYLEYLLERGVIYQDHGLWVNRSLDEEDMPETVRTAIRRRIEGLGEGERDLLSLAAVQGDHFEGALLARSLGQPATRVLRALEALARRTRLVKAAGAGYRFSHPVLAESFYQLLPETKRRHYHVRLARVLEDERPGQTEALAHHLFRAGLYDQALPHLMEAARRAREAHAYREARLLLIQAQTASEALNGRTPRQTELNLLLQLADMEERLGDPDRCLELAEKVVQRADERLEKAPVAEGLMLTGWVKARQGNWHDAERAYRRCLELYAALGDESSATTVQLQRGNIAFERSRLEEAAAAYRDARATATKCGNFALLGSICGNLGVVATVRGDHVQAVLHYTEAIKAYSRIKHRYGICQTYQNLGKCHAGQEDWATALSCYAKGEKLARELGTVDVLANLLVSRAIVHVARGELEEAEVACARARQLMDQLSSRIGMAECHKVEGMIDRERGLYPRATDHLEKGMAAFQDLENDLGVAECELELAVVEQRQGELVRARRRLEDSIRRFEQVGAAGDAQRGQALLAEMAA